MAQSAMGEQPDSVLFRKTLSVLTEKYGEPETIEDDFFGSYRVNLWQLKDRQIQLVAKPDDKKNNLSMASHQRGGDRAGRRSPGVDHPPFCDP